LLHELGLVAMQGVSARLFGFFDRLSTHSEFKEAAIRRKCGYKQE
jgi:hypothetical protein